jgi:murein DD-endopeptidase MepM/ murein hydrolase activator NlpD
MKIDGAGFRAFTALWLTRILEWLRYAAGRVGSFFHGLKFKYKILITNESALEDVFSVRRSGYKFLWYFCALVVAIFLISSMLINFTPLKHYLPGYADADIKAKLIHESLKVDSLEQIVLKNEQYVDILRNVVSGNISTQGHPKVKVDSLARAGASSKVNLASSDREKAYDETYEESERFNLNVLDNKRNAGSVQIFFKPTKGVVARHYDPIHGQNGIDVASSPNESVSAVLDGTVIFAAFTADANYVIAIQHDNQFVSFYKNNSYLLKNVGDRVRAGEVIAIVGYKGGKTKDAHLLFELWRSGSPVNPEEYIVF